MMRLLTAAVMAAGITSPALATPKIPLSAAMAQCRALDGPSAVAQAHYRDCVLARSGQLPPQARKSTRGGITVSGSARIGIVVQTD